jgi:hypothetical protein
LLFGVEDDERRVYADESRRLTVADPDGRELSVSVGCALENLLVAAERFGVGRTVEYVSNGASESGPGGSVGADAAGRRNRGGGVRIIERVRRRPKTPRAGSVVVVDGLRDGEEVHPFLALLSVRL